MCTHLHVLVLSTQSKTKLLVIVSKFNLTYALTFYFTLMNCFYTLSEQSCETASKPLFL